ncbi:hypothetical protein MACK_001082 [Theileria orientalis]|uniref:Uncharacterized protein n=1 Tax=Theileria orientalis TaxID=68886 RepID=A0A976MBX2_THEOR|nr:hypothetical protein MACK_001082 [Theileria orientalis]
MTLQEGSSTYRNKVVKKAQVYFNRYDTEHKYPLLFVIFFQGDGSSNRYYKRSRFQSEITSRDKKLIAQLQPYYTEQKILIDLINENDNIPEPLTYNIGKTADNSKGNLYNNNKIKVVEDKSIENKLGQNGFKKYKHTPEAHHTRKKSCVMYNDNTLLDCNGEKGDTIDEIQGKVLKNVIVFFSNKNPKQPLLAGFEIQESEWVDYYYKKCQNRFHWQKLDREATRELLGNHTNDSDIHKNLIQNEDKLVEILKNVEFSVFNAVVILADKTVSYSKGEASRALNNVEPKITSISLIPEAQPNIIDVNKHSCKRFEEKNYYCYLHTISPVGTLETAELRLLIPNSITSDKFSEIKFYKDEKTAEEDREYLFYNKSVPNTSYLYFYLYGSDPRPLLLCHGTKTYRPKDKTSYSTQWVIVSGLQISVCQGSSNESSLLDELTKVVGALNQVNLFEHPDVHTSKEYIAHQYDGKDVKIQVEYQEIKSYSSPASNSCFRKFEHTPKGIDSHGSVNGFRLGDVSYIKSGERNNSISYTKDSTYKHHPLLKVSAYFYEKDVEYKDPLLVELQFKMHPSGTTNEYYKLSSTEKNNLSWYSDDQASEKVASGGKELAIYLEKLRYEFKKVAKIQIEYNQGTKYELKGGKSFESLLQYKQIAGKELQVSEFLECENLKDANYHCFIHKLTDSNLNQIHSEIGALKITIPNQLPYQNNNLSDADQEICLYEIKQGNEWKLKAKIKENINKDEDNLYDTISSMVTEYTPIYYSFCMGDLFVYFKKDDTRPLLVCLNGMAYRPLKLPKLNEQNYNYNNADYTNWIRSPEITSCACQEEDNVISVLKEVESIYDGDNTVAIATSTTVTLGLTGGGTGLAIYKYPDFFLSLLRKVFSKGAA